MPYLYIFSQLIIKRIMNIIIIIIPEVINGISERPKVKVVGRIHLKR